MSILIKQWGIYRINTTVRGNHYPGKRDDCRALNNLGYVGSPGLLSVHYGMPFWLILPLAVRLTGDYFAIVTFGFSDPRYSFAGQKWGGRGRLKTNSPPHNVAFLQELLRLSEWLPKPVAIGPTKPAMGILLILQRT